MFDVLMRSNSYYRFTRLARREQKALETLHSFTDSVIAARRKELEEIGDSPKLEDADPAFGIKRKLNLIDLLLQTTCDGHRLSDRDIREEIDTFMFEGHDTTTSAIAFTIYMLAKHPNEQDRAYQEVVQVIGEGGTGPASLQTLNELHYLELCIKETLRLFPSVPLFARKATQDVEISEFNSQSVS